MEKEYWDKYYTRPAAHLQPSNFARFCASQYDKRYGTLFDIGCGNGRDTLYFSSQSIPCVGIDQCEGAIASNALENEARSLNASFHHGDFSMCDYDLLATAAYSIYSRFTLHAISYLEEERLFQHLAQGPNLRYLFVEARSINDGLYGQGEEVGPHEFVTSHYRRFIDPEVLKSKLEDQFDIEHFEEGQGFSKTETEDPCLIRVVAKRR